MSIFASQDFHNGCGESLHRGDFRRFAADRVRPCLSAEQPRPLTGRNFGNFERRMAIITCIYSVCTYSSWIFSKYTDYHCIYSHTDHCKTVRFKGIKYLTHRITYQSYYHDILPASSRNEISHTLYLGSITSREVYQILKGWSFSMLTVETETLILCILSKRTIFLIKRARHALYFLVHGLGAPFLLMDC